MQPREVLRVFAATEGRLRLHLPPPLPRQRRWWRARSVLPLGTAALNCPRRPLSRSRNYIAFGEGSR
jgi:hypothetical protein